MVFDSQEYNGTCVCGKEHKSTTLFCIVESGCLRDIGTYTEKYGLTGFSVAVYDENTYAATSNVKKEPLHESSSFVYLRILLTLRSSVNNEKKVL